MNIKPLSISITIPAKDVTFYAEEAAVALAGLDEYDNSALLELGLTRKALVQSLVEDPKFIQAVVKSVETMVRSNADLVVDELYDTKIPRLAELEKKLQKIQERRDMEEAKREESQQIKDSIKYLKAQGYSITK